MLIYGPPHDEISAELNCDDNIFETSATEVRILNLQTGIDKQIMSNLEKELFAIWSNDGMLALITMSTSDSSQNGCPKMSDYTIYHLLTNSFDPVKKIIDSDTLKTVCKINNFDCSNVIDRYNTSNQH